MTARKQTLTRHSAQEVTGEGCKYPGLLELHHGTECPFSTPRERHRQCDREMNRIGYKLRSPTN